MSENLTFGLSLEDKVSGPAKAAADALRRVESSAHKAQNALMGPSSPLTFTKELDRIRGQASKLKFDPQGYRDLLKAQKELGKLQHELGKPALAKQIKATTIAAGVALGEIALHAAEKFVDVIKEGIKGTFEAIAHEQERRAGYQLTLGAKGGAEQREMIEQFSGKTAFTPSQNQDMMLKLFRSGFKGQGATQAYAMALDLAAAGGKGADQATVEDIIDKLGKIQAKGGITSKGLTGMNLGAETVPQFYKDLAKKLGVTAKEAEKLSAQPGGVPVQTMMNVIGRSIEKQQGGKLASGGELASKGLTGRWKKFKNIPEEFAEKLTDSGAIGKFADALGRVVERLDPSKDPGKQIVAKLDEMLTKLAGTVEKLFTPKNIDAFIEGVKGLVGAVGSLVTGLGKMYDLMVKISEFTGGLGHSDLSFEQTVNVMKRGLGSERAQKFAQREFDKQPEEWKAQMRADAKKRGVSTVQMGGVTIQVNVEGGSNPSETGKKIVQELEPKVPGIFERAAMEQGYGVLQ